MSTPTKYQIEIIAQALDWPTVALGSTVVQGEARWRDLVLDRSLNAKQLQMAYDGLTDFVNAAFDVVEQAALQARKAVICPRCEHAFKPRRI